VEYANAKCNLKKDKKIQIIPFCETLEILFIKHRFLYNYITLKKKLGYYNKLDDKILHSIFNWLQQPIFGCSSQFLIVLTY